MKNTVKKSVKDLKRHITQNIHTADKHIKGCLTSLLSGKMQSQTTMKNYTHSKRIKFKKLTSARVGEELEELKLSVDRNGKLHYCFCEAFLQFLQILNISLRCSVLLLCMYPRELKANVHTKTRGFICKEPCTVKIQYVYSQEWTVRSSEPLNLKVIVLNERI